MVFAMDAATLAYFVQGDPPAGFVEAMRSSPQDLKLWCAKQPLEVLRKAKQVLHVHHTVWHEVLREEIEAWNAAEAKKVAGATDKRATVLAYISIALAMLAVVIAIVLALR
jgi:hypothetical protein